MSLTNTCKNCAMYERLVRDMERRIAELEAAQAQAVPDGSALEQYNRLMAEDNETAPIERLRFFCSLAFNQQDWLDSEQFFDALAAAPTPAGSQQSEIVAWLVRDPITGGWFATTHKPKNDDVLRKPLIEAAQPPAAPASHNDGWFPIETEPKDGTFIEVKMPNGTTDTAQWCDYSNDKYRTILGEWNSERGNVYTEPTHWQPCHQHHKSGRGDEM